MRSRELPVEDGPRTAPGVGGEVADTTQHIHPGPQSSHQHIGYPVGNDGGNMGTSPQSTLAPVEANRAPPLDHSIEGRASLTDLSLTPEEERANTCPACGCFVFAGGAHCLNPHCQFWYPPGILGEGFIHVDGYPPGP